MIGKSKFSHGQWSIGQCSTDVNTSFGVLPDIPRLAGYLRLGNGRLFLVNRLLGGSNRDMGILKRGIKQKGRVHVIETIHAGDRVPVCLLLNQVAQPECAVEGIQSHGIQRRNVCARH